MITSFDNLSGIVPVQLLKELYGQHVIQSHPDFPINPEQFQPNSLDLRLGKMAYRVRCSFLPENESVRSKLSKLSMHSFSIQDGAVLEPNCSYIIPLLESVHFDLLSTALGNASLSEIITAKANPKSSTGRLDIFTRVITDFSHRFEEIQSGYSGNLYLEVVPKTFPIRVKTGQKLNQLRIRIGDTTLTDAEIKQVHTQSPLLLHDSGEPLSTDKIKVGNGLFMSVNLSGKENEVIGYKAKKNRDLIDLDKLNHYEVNDFWDPIYAQQNAEIILEPEAFYIFASKERCIIPVDYAAEMVPYDTGSGELRTHYAGFFDSGFGLTADGKGARAVLEVRSHDVPFLIEDGQTFFRMVFEKNALRPDYAYGSALKSNYQGQSLKLGKQFKG
jgi:dCTP deaminase